MVKANTPIKRTDPEDDDAAGNSKTGNAGATQRVYLGILQSLEQRQMVPGQRLAETELAVQFGVGRNAVREAMQRLAVRGVVELRPNRSATIRKLDIVEITEIMEVAAELTSLAATIAARKYDAAKHSALFDTVMSNLSASNKNHRAVEFSRARRQFYRTLLQIGGNRELQRLFLAIGVHVIYSQYQSYELQQIRLADYNKNYKAVSARDIVGAAKAGRAHVLHEQDFIAALSHEA
ncbi:MAG: GntR family transcriptional regulator [Sphingomonadales bacterium]|nr:GntR family transcriptional regulator [Sphingomonadales bacterium]